MESKIGDVSKSFRIALDSRSTLQKLNFSEYELIETTAVNLYPEYSIGVPGYKQTGKFASNLMTLFHNIIQV